MSAVGKACFKCGHILNEEEIDKITKWGEYTGSDFGLMVHAELNYPDDEAVVCWNCHTAAESKARKAYLGVEEG